MAFGCDQYLVKRFNLYNVSNLHNYSSTKYTQYTTTAQANWYSLFWILVNQAHYVYKSYTYKIDL